ncbi:MAG: hypothetical protein WCJ35_06545 [Planctomycetota bacterium]
MMNLMRIPDYATPAPRQAAEAINGRITEAEALLAEARRQADEAKTQAVDVMTCDPDQATQAAGNLRRAEIAYLRSEIEIRRDVRTLESFIGVDRAATLRAVEAEITTTISEIKAGLDKLGFRLFLDLPDPLLQYPVDAFCRQFNTRLAALLERQRLLSSCSVGGGGNETAIEQATRRLRELLDVPTAGPMFFAVQEALHRPR